MQTHTIPSILRMRPKGPSQNGYLGLTAPHVSEQEKYPGSDFLSSVCPALSQQQGLMVVSQDPLAVADLDSCRAVAGLTAICARM